MKKQSSTKHDDMVAETEGLLRKLLHGLKQDLIHGAEDCGTKLTRLEYTILHILSDAAVVDTTITNISVLMDVEPPTLVAAIAKLERKKLVSKTRDPNDRRRMPLVITPAGKALTRKILEPMNRSFANVFANIGEQKGRQFLNLLKEIIEHRSP
jgi:DNA-binding MarR family transcriptional regulator